MVLGIIYIWGRHSMEIHIQKDTKIVAASLQRTLHITQCSLGLQGNFMKEIVFNLTFTGYYRISNSLNSNVREMARDESFKDVLVPPVDPNEEYQCLCPYLLPSTAGCLVNSAICKEISKFCPDVFQCSNATSMGISYFKLCRISQWLNPVNSNIKLHALVSRSELCGHISKFQFVVGLNVKEILRESINSDCKFMLPHFFRFRQKFTYSDYLPSPNLFSSNELQWCGHYGFLSRIYWLDKLGSNWGSNWFIIISQNLLTSKIHMILKIQRYLWLLPILSFKYVYEIKAN